MTADEIIDEILTEEILEIHDDVQFKREIEKFQEDYPQHQEKFDRIILWFIQNGVSGKPASKILKRINQALRQADKK